MEIIIYTQIENPQIEKLENEIAKISYTKPIIVFDFESLFNTHRLKISGEVIIVFFISSEDELDFLISSKEQLFNSQYIFIITSTDENIRTKGLSLYPRYLTGSSYGFKDVSAVLNKIIRNNMKDIKKQKEVNIN